MSLTSLRPSTKARTTSSRPRTAGSAAAALEAAKAAGEALARGGGLGAQGVWGLEFRVLGLWGSIKISSFPGHPSDGGVSSENYSN